MFRLIQYIRSLVNLTQKLDEEALLQRTEGYSIESLQTGPDPYFLHTEIPKRRKLVIYADFSYLNDVSVLLEAVPKRTRPKGQELTTEERKTLKERSLRYFSCWGGGARFEITPLIYDVEIIKG